MLLAGLLSLELLELNSELADLLNFVGRLKLYWLTTFLSLVCDLFQSHQSKLVHLLQFTFLLVQYPSQDQAIFI